MKTFCVLCVSLLMQSLQPVTAADFNVNVGVYQQRDHAEITSQYTGVIEATHEANLSFEFSGKITQLYVDDFAIVEAGDLLAEQDVTVLLERQNALQAALRRYEADAELARRSYERIKRLFESERASAQQFDEAQHAKEAANDAVAQIKADLAQANLEIAKKRLYAPFSGVISKRLSDNNEFVAPGQTIFRLVDPDNIRARIGVPGSLHQRFRFQQPVSLSVEQQPVTGMLIGRDIQQAISTRTVDLLFSVESGVAYPGQLVRAAITTQINALGYWIPSTALTAHDKGRWTIYTVDPQNRIQPQAVTVLHVEDEQAYIQARLPAEITIVNEGVDRIVPGQQISASGVAP